jgi:hypothetical protein
MPKPLIVGIIQLIGLDSDKEEHEEEETDVVILGAQHGAEGDGVCSRSLLLAMWSMIAW